MAYQFSPSTLNLLKDCPRCFWLQFNKGVKRPLGIFPSLPNGMDRILKSHFDSFRDRGLLPPELKQLSEESNGDLKLFDNAILLEKWRNNFDGIQWFDEQGNRIRGAVDNILQKGNKLIVLDYKTRGFPLKEDTAQHYQNQMDMYNFLLRKNNYETEDYAYLVFYHPNKVTENGDVVFHTDIIKMETSVKNAEQIISRALEVLNGPIPSAAESCGYCPYRDSMNTNQQTVLFK